MSETSTNLMLPYLAAGQAQKHVTVNESLRRLDVLVQLSVVSATVTAQPGSPADGAVYILPAGKTGAAWGPMSNFALAYWRDGAWEQISPREGWLAFVKDTDQLLYYTGSSWNGLPAAIGLGSAAEPTFGSVRLATAAGAPGVKLIGHQFGALNDDTATSLQSQDGTLGWIFLLNSGAEYALLLYDFVGTPGISVIFGHANVAVTSGALAGTTATDGKLTLSVHTDNKIYIENRLGSTRILGALVLA